MGDVLSQAVDGIGALVSALDQLGEALSPTTIATTSDTLEQAASALAVLPDVQSRRRLIITTLGDQRAALNERVVDIRTSLAYMSAFTINMKIVAGGIVSAAVEFGLFAREVIARIDAGRQELDAIDRNVAQLKKDLEKTNVDAGALEQRCRELIPLVPDQLRASAKVMGEHHVRLTEAAAGAGQLARDIRKKVARMLAALLHLGDKDPQGWHNYRPLSHFGENPPSRR